MNCPVCEEEIVEGQIFAKVQTLGGQQVVHRHCLLIAEHEAAAEALCEQGLTDLADQSQRRADFYRAHNEAVREAEAENDGSASGLESIVQEAARACGFAGREKDWAAQILLLEAQRIVNGPAAIIAGNIDWEGHAKEWHRRCVNLRDYLATMVFQAMSLRKRNQPDQYRQLRTAKIVKSIEETGKPPEDSKPAIQVFQTMPGVKPS